MTDRSSPLPLTYAQAAACVGVSVRTIKREVADGHLVPVRIRGCVRILASDLQTYLQARRIPACPSDDTAKDGRLASSTLGVGLAALLGPGRTRSSSSAAPATASTIVELAEHRATRSRKRSSAG